MHTDFQFVDRTGLAAEPLKLIPAVIIPKEAIDAEIERLASLPAPANGRRVSAIVNPLTGPGDGLAPGTAVSLSVLKPGERTEPIRHNSSQVNFCIRGGGTARVDGKSIRYEQYDVWNTPPWAVYEHCNDTSELQVRLTYSNSALLEKMLVHVVEENPQVAAGSNGAEECETHGENPFGTFQLTEEGGFLMPYEKLINPDVVKHKALHFPWKRVKAELDKLTALGQSYVGRRLYLLYNPATQHTNGTTSNFFATMCVRPKNIVDRPHRHSAAAINYYFSGRGYSVVEGKKYHWKAGDLMLSAPGWAIHNHASLDEDVYELTVQDTPLNIWMGSLLWQERLNQPLQSLGSTGGFTTNRAVAETVSR
ncbi:MAG TPA: cupin domain-containing protein [Bryobacteraceae bacterium]|nr:cupin domain-containing protein [Bryobacteraceae bacterium]